MVSARAANALGGRTLALKPTLERPFRLTIGHWFYRFFSVFLSGPVLLWLWWRGFKEPGYRRGLTERLGFVTPGPSALGGLWVHVASVGEAQAALILLPSLKQQWGPSAITWTTQTPAAKTFLLDRTQGQVKAWFAPLDTASATQRFLRRVQPRMLLLLERELWPEWLWQCESRAITVVVANARLKTGSIESWPYNTRWMRQRIQSLALALCADTVSTQRFRQLGISAKHALDMGNLKFDQGPSRYASLDIADAIKERKVVVAASTHAGDEDAILAGWAEWSYHNPKGLLVLAPRHTQRFKAIALKLEFDFGLIPNNELAIRSQAHMISDTTKLVLWDTIGELTQLYPYAHLCLMGGTWAPVGGHNALEPLASGCPVFFGPHTHQFPDLYAQMLNEGAARCVLSHDIWANVQSYLIDEPCDLSSMREAGLEFVKAQQGSADRTVIQLSNLNCWPKTPMCDLIESGTLHKPVWTNSAQTAKLTKAAFEMKNYGQTAVSLATGSGRGHAYRVESSAEFWILRHYRRGGLFSLINTDRYFESATAQTRGMKELALLREMVSLGLPVPDGVAAICDPQHPWLGSWFGYRADILVKCIPNALNLAQSLDTSPLMPKTWREIGSSIAKIHLNQIYHSDLNCHNILLNDKGNVWLIDFDKCERRKGNQWKSQNLDRLLRSLRKETERRPGFFWQEAHWADLLSGYKAQQKLK